METRIAIGSNGRSVARVVYFSGTGCTEYVAREIERQLTASGMEVHVHSLREGAAEPNGRYDILVLCFAVHACNAPVPVLRWAERHETVDKIPAAVVSVSGGGEVTPNLACREKIKRALSKKGFCVRYEEMLVMPSNWIVATKPALAARLLEILPEKVKVILDEFTTGVVRTVRPGLGNRFLSLIGALEPLGARTFGKRIRIGRSCNGCALCARGCPAGNISMKNGKPEFGDACVLCLRCIYGCPRKALTPGTLKFILVKEGFDLQAIAATIPWNDPVDVEAEATGYLWLGVKRYLLDRTR